VRDREAQLPPGQQARTRKAKLAGYGLQLREKQKVKRIYGVLETSFPGYFEPRIAQGDHRRSAAAAARSGAGQRDYRLAWPRRGRRRGTRATRTLPRERKKVTSRRIRPKQGDVVTVLGRSQKSTASSTRWKRQRTRHPRLAVVRRELDHGRIMSIPTREQINLPVQEQLIVSCIRIVSLSLTSEVCDFRHQA